MKPGSGSSSKPAYLPAGHQPGPGSVNKVTLTHALEASPLEKERLAGIHIPFIANEGQADPAVAFYAPTFAGTVFIKRDGQIVYSLPGKSAGREKEPQGRPRAAASAGWSLTESPVGATSESRRARPVAQKRAQTQVSYFLGNDPSAWRSGIATYEGVSLGQVWPGVTLSLRAYGKNVEKLFTVEPGADPSLIRMRVSGARSLRTDEGGELIASTGPGDVRLTRPAAYQEQGGARRAVAVAYEARGEIYGFRLGSYDSALPIVIDPLVRATYLGGTGYEEAIALVIHPTSGDVYVAGLTTSTDFPGTTGGAQAANGGGYDGFVVRLNASLTTLTQATYFGGSGDDVGDALVIHPTSGDVYVAGRTPSTDFPGTAGGAQAANGGGQDAFVARLNSSLTTLIQATYLGGTGYDQANCLAIHPMSGDVYAAGYTTSTDFPGTTGAAQAANGGGYDAFVARLNASLTTLTQATYLGGSGTDAIGALAIHPTSGDVYVGAETNSTDFPGTAGGAQAANGGGDDAFVARLNSSLTTLIQATYLGSSSFDTGTALAIHPTSGDVYVAGWTISTDFPGTIGGAQATNGGDDDDFVARLNSSLTTLIQATYLGGSGTENGGVLAIHPTSGDVYVAGHSASTDFPGTTGGAQAANGGGYDDFIARFSPNLASASESLPCGPTPNEFPVPTASSSPAEITAGPDGALWFTEQIGKIGQITVGGVITEFTLPTGSSNPFGIIAGPDGALWFTEENHNMIDRITTGGVFTEFTVPTAGSVPLFITVGPDGALWFTEQSGNNIGRITTGGAFTEFPVPTGGSFPSGITAGPDSALWFTENSGNKIGQITTGGVITEFTVPTVGSQPQAITAGPDGALWFVEQNGNNIGRITTGGVITEFPIPTASSAPYGPYGITAGPDGALWFTELSGNKIGRITTGGVITEFTVPTAGGGPVGITAGPDGALWFAEVFGNNVGRICTTATPNPTNPPTSTPTLTPTNTPTPTPTLTPTNTPTATRTSTPTPTTNPCGATVSGTATVCKGSATTIQAALTGTGPWNLIWSDGFTQTVAVSPASRNVAPNVTTSYTVTSVSNASCTSSGSGSAVITVELPPKAAVSGGTTICAGSSATIQAALTGTPPWNLVWSDGFAQTVSASPATRTVSPTSTTGYSLTAVSDAACTGGGSGSATIKVNPVPSSTITAPASVCANSSGNAASVPNAGGQATYTWSISNGTITSGAGSKSIKFSADAAGSVTITITVTSPSGCTSTSTITIPINC